MGGWCRRWSSTVLGRRTTQPVVAVVVVAALGLAVTACGASSGGGTPASNATNPTASTNPLSPTNLPTSTNQPTSTSQPTSSSEATSTSQPGSTNPSTGSASTCTLTVIENIQGESSTTDQARTASWILQHDNGWTVFTPGGDWHLSASSQGLDVGAPQGGSDASLASWPSTTPWTYSSLAAQVLSQVSDIKVICRSPNEQSSGGESQATEFTGMYQGEHIHAILVLSLLAQTTSGLFDGQTRSVYTPASQWSATNEAVLWLIIKRAILNPSTVG